MLRAVGWRGSRILRMIGFESLILCLVASVVGIALGLLASRAVLLVPAISSYLDPVYEPAVFVRALASRRVRGGGGRGLPGVPCRAPVADGGVAA